MLGSGSVSPEKMQQPAQGGGMKKCCGGTSKKMQSLPPQGGVTEKQKGMCVYCGGTEKQKGVCSYCGRTSKEMLPPPPPQGGGTSKKMQPPAPPQGGGTKKCCGGTSNKVQPPPPQGGGTKKCCGGASKKVQTLPPQGEVTKKCCGGASKKVQPPPPQGGGRRKQRGVCSCPEKYCRRGGGGYPNMTEEDSKKFIEEGYACPSNDKHFNPDLIPDGALLKHHPDFQSIWSRYRRQLKATNNMDMDTYPGVSDLIVVWPLNWPNTTKEYYSEVNDLAIFAIQEYNKEPSHFFKYELLKIEKVNARLSGYLEFFITVKVRNLTLGTVVETFQIHTGRDLFVRFQVLAGTLDQRSEDIYSCLPKGGDSVDSFEEEIACSELRQFSPEKKPSSAEELLVWQRELPRRFLANEVLWDDDVFIPEDALEKHPPIFRRIYRRYFNQICETEGFDIDIYPGDSMAAMYIPYLDFEKEIGLLMDLAKHAIQEYNNREIDDYKYEVESVEKVNFILAECREFFMTVKVKNLTLCTPVETFQIHAYKGPDVENVARTCRKKLFEVLVDEEMAGSKSRQFSPEKKPKSAEDLIAWQRGLPRRFLSNIEVFWDAEVFIPKGVSKKNPAIFCSIYRRYFSQICETEGFDIDIYPGDSVAAMYIPYLDFQKRIVGLMDLAEHAIWDYNNREISIFKYKLLKIEKVNVRWLGDPKLFHIPRRGYCEHFVTVKAINLTLGTVVETFQIHTSNLEYVISCLPKGAPYEGLVDSSEEELAGSESRQFSPERKPNSVEELLAWQRELPRRFLANEVLWDDDVFIPEDALEKHPPIFRRIYRRYFNQICETEGFDIDIYPGDSLAAMYIPYLDFVEEIGLLMDLAEYAIQDYNNREIDDYKYKVEFVEKVNFILGECREFIMTVKVKNLTLGTPVETFQIHAYKGPDVGNVVRTCRRKLFKLS